MLGGPHAEHSRGAAPGRAVLSAVEEFIAASDRIRLARRFAAECGRDTELEPTESAVHRVVAARARCVELGLWEEAEGRRHADLLDGRDLQLIRVRTGPSEPRFLHWVRRRRDVA